MPARTSPRLSGAACFALILASAVPVFSHDLWIVPGKFFLQPGEKTRVFVNSGDTFPTSAALVNAARIQTFTVHTGPSAENPVINFVAEGESLTTEIAAAEAGSLVLTLALEPRLIRLKPEEFHRYLMDEGLPQLVRLREALGESEHPAVERYTKWAKALLFVGVREDGRWSEPTGMRLELVPQSPPQALRRGGTMLLVVLFEGKPLPDVTVVGGRAGTPAHRVSAVTDSNGEISLVLQEAGRWYLRALHVTRLQDDPEADWESFWTTITFQVPH